MKGLSIISWLAIVAVAGAFVAPLAAQSAGAGSSFERGVEAYVSGENSAAESLLAEAAHGDPRDPRPPYFRALALFSLGRPVEAREEMLRGAELESASQSAYPVAESLAQMPLAGRLMIDKFRWRSGVVRAVTQPENDAFEPPRPIVTDAAVLRQRVAVRLDQLVQPVSLDELVQASTQPLSHAEQISAGNPFADDRSTASDESTGKIPSGKLLGILGNALFESAPVPSLEGLRDKLPNVPLSVAGQEAGSAAAPVAPSVAAPATAVDADDPFFEPSAAPAVQPPAEKHEEIKSDASEEDPFG